MKTLKTLFLAVALIASYSLTAQVAVTTDGTSADGSAMLDVKSTEKGMLIPRMTQTEIEAITSPANGLTVFCTTDDTFYTFILAANVWKEILYGTGTITPPLVVGDSYGGGIIFYLDGTGEHGLIASTADLSSAIQWTTSAYYSGTVPNGATSLTDGLANSNAIVAQAGAGITYAAGLCRAYSATGDGGLYDWFLPSKDELNLMYLNIGPGNALGLGNIGGFASAYYWSSSENDANYAWGQNFSNGSQNGSYKNITDRVRAVRAF